MQHFVEVKQESGVFGHAVPASSSQDDPLDGFEVDETCLRKRDVGENMVEWNEYVGMKRRGDPESLYLEQRDVERSRSQRKPNGGASPPPYTKEEWLNLANKKVRPGALQHSDGAKAYQQNIEGVQRDYVSHSFRGHGPEFVKSSSASSTALAGTQSLDGWWGHAKKNLTGLASDSDKIGPAMREAQWRHWFAESDKMVAAGTVVRFCLLNPKDFGDGA